MNLNRPDQTRRRGTDGYDRPEKIRRLDVLNIDTGSWSCLFRPETTGARSRQIHLPWLLLGVKSQSVTTWPSLFKTNVPGMEILMLALAGTTGYVLGHWRAGANATLSDASAGAYPVDSSRVPSIESVRVQAPASKPDETTEWEAIRYLGCRFRANIQRLHSLLQLHQDLKSFDNTTQCITVLQ